MIEQQDPWIAQYRDWLAANLGEDLVEDREFRRECGPSEGVLLRVGPGLCGVRDPDLKFLCPFCQEACERLGAQFIENGVGQEPGRLAGADSSGLGVEDGRVCVGQGQVSPPDVVVVLTQQKKASRPAAERSPADTSPRGAP